ncbi:hypothetical protein [Enterococcus gilvus]|uniref:hypothetical protein n=1 Tax=Enterococcus gilvus TaxID=160453 RepID=UPI0028D553CF|nr:hypothetical protein [Enterococcus gilvus]
MSNQMKRILYYTVTGLLIVTVGILSMRLYSQQRVLSDQSQAMAQLQRNKKQLSDQLNETQSRFATVQQTINKKESVKNNDKTSERFKRFSDVLKAYFTKMNTYTPNSYGSRKEQVRGYLTEALYKQYFSNKQTIGDSNQITSRSKTVKVYTKANQDGEDMEGIVVASYETSSDDGDSWKPGKTLFEVTYDPYRERISAITNMGNSFTGDMIQ